MFFCLYLLSNFLNKKLKYKILKKRRALVKKQSSYLKMQKAKDTGITLIALVVTTIFCYDEFLKASNNKGFLLQTI